MSTKVRERSAVPVDTISRVQDQLPVGSRVNGIAVVIDQFSYGPRGRKGKEIYNQFFDAIMEAGVGKRIRFDQHILTSVQRHQLFKTALKNRAKALGFDVIIGGLRLAQNQYYLEAELTNTK